MSQFKNLIYLINKIRSEIIFTECQLQNLDDSVLVSLEAESQEATNCMAGSCYKFTHDSGVRFKNFTSTKCESQISVPYDLPGIERKSSNSNKIERKSSNSKNVERKSSNSNKIERKSSNSKNVERESSNSNKIERKSSNSKNVEMNHQFYLFVNKSHSNSVEVE